MTVGLGDPASGVGVGGQGFGVDALGTASDGGWAAAWAGWAAARQKVDLRQYLRAGLPDLPGLDQLAGRLGWKAPDALAEGLSGPVDLGPLHLDFASGSLVVKPP